MRNQPGFFDADDRLKRLRDFGDQLEALRATVGFEIFRPELNMLLSARKEAIDRSVRVAPH